MIEDKIYKEIEEWFMKLFNLSIQKQNGDYIYFYYNKDYIKKYKIAVAFDVDKPEYIFNNDGIIFKQHLKNDCFLIEYFGYWSFLETKYSLNYDKISEITTAILNKNTNLMQYTTGGSFMQDIYNIE